MFGSLLYLTSRTTWNRFTTQIRRIRQPRYALAILAVVAYFWLFLVAPDRPGRETGNPFAFLTGGSGRTLMTVAVFLFFASAWFFGRRIDALAFSQAEVHFLFPAPVTRRWLIIFKLVRMQIAIVISAIIWTILVRRGTGDLHPLARVLGFWLVLATISLHQVGAALVHVSVLRGGVFGDRGQRVATAILVLLSTLLAWAAYSAWQVVSVDPGLADSNFLVRLAAAVNQPLLHALLSPFELLGTVAFAASMDEWIGALPFAAALLALHVILIVRADFPFEESAAEASARVAKRVADFRARGLRSNPRLSARSVRSTRLPLSARGNPAVAIIWKNVLAFLRSLRGTSLVLILIIAAPLVVAIMLSADSSEALEVAAIVAAMILIWSVFLGPRFVRNDLRADLTQLELLKTFPLSGRRIVAAEVMSATLSLTAVQAVVALILSLFFLLRNPAYGSTWDNLVLLVLLPFSFFAVNALNITIQNGVTLLFPAWMTLGINKPAGVEALGQNILVAIGSIVLLVLALIPAAVSGATLYLLLADVALRWRVAAVATMALAVLLAEVSGLMVLLGRLFERTEPSAFT